MTDEEAAEAWANERCILRSGDRQQVCYEGFLAGVEYGRKLIEQREREVWEQGLIDGWTAARDKVLDGHPQIDGYKYKFDTLQEFKDWKKERGGE